MRAIVGYQAPLTHSPRAAKKAPMSTPRRFDHDEIIRLYGEERSSVIVAHRIGCSVRLVLRVLAENNVPVRNLGPRLRPGVTKRVLARGIAAEDALVAAGVMVR